MVNHFFGLFTNINCHWYLRWFVVLYDYICGFDGCITAQSPHGYTNVTQGYYGGIIDAITNESHTFTHSLYFLDFINLIFRK
ncbi:hypothetical protein D3C81_1104670 [compost metagenome]